MKYLEKRLGHGPLSDIAKLMNLFAVDERDSMAVLIRFALDRMTAEDSSLYFEEYIKTKQDHIHHRPGRRTRDYEETPFPYQKHGALDPLVEAAPSPQEVAHLRAELAQERHRANYDDLTGLWNRRAAMHAIDYGAPVSMVALCDIDRFKSINDSHGHHAGDSVLKAVAGRLAHAMQDWGHACRLGGDEFLLIWKEIPDDPEAEAVKVRDAVGIDFPYHGNGSVVTNVVLKPSISMGLAKAQDGAALSAHTLLSAADRAMYLAKKKGNKIVMVTMNEDAQVIPSRPAGGPIARRRSNRARTTALGIIALAVLLGSQLTDLLSLVAG